MIISQVITYFKQHRIQILRFAVVGIITFILYYFLFWLFFGLLILNYRLAITFAYIITVITHFTLHRLYTYRKGKSPILGHLGRYGTMLAINYATTLIITIATVEIVNQSPYFGVFIATCITTFLNFIIMKYFVFY